MFWVFGVFITIFSAKGGLLALLKNDFLILVTKVLFRVCSNYCYKNIIAYSNFEEYDLHNYHVYANESNVRGVFKILK